MPHLGHLGSRLELQGLRGDKNVKIKSNVIPTFCLFLRTYETEKYQNYDNTKNQICLLLVYITKQRELISN